MNSPHPAYPTTWADLDQANARHYATRPLTGKALQKADAAWAEFYAAIDAGKDQDEIDRLATVAEDADLLHGEIWLAEQKTGGLSETERQAYERRITVQA